MDGAKNLEIFFILKQDDLILVKIIINLNLVAK